MSTTHLYTVVEVIHRHGWPTRIGLIPSGWADNQYAEWGDSDIIRVEWIDKVDVGETIEIRRAP